MNIFNPNVNEDEHVIAVYDVSCITNLRDAAWDIAIGQSVGNPNVRNKWETDELFENHSCKILHTESGLSSKKSGLISIAFPIINTDWNEDGITHLLVQLMGGQLDIDKITRCRLIDIKFPPKVLSYFKGPKYGMSGVRKFTGAYGKPLLGAIVKPKIGITPQVLLEMVKELVEGGVNFIKEDEIMANPAICPISVRVPLISEYLKDKNVIYAVCINGDAPYALERAKLVHTLGGNAVHINFWAGLGIYKSIRDLDLPLFIHFQKSGDKILTDESHRFGIDWSVICRLAGMSGVDTIHAGMIGGYSTSDPTKLLYSLDILAQHNVVPALSCGMHPGLVEYIRGQIGNNFMANCGGCIHGHDGGTLSGVRAMSQAIERTHKEEYKSAIKKWGKKTPLHVIIPMAGHGKRFSEFGFKTDKFLLPVDKDNTPMIKKAIDTLNVPEGSSYTFITQDKLKDILKPILSCYNGTTKYLSAVSDGPATTASYGLPDEDDVPILVSNSDQILENWNCNNFLEKCVGYDGAVLTYTPSYNLPSIGEIDKHSFVENKDGLCVKFAEKIVLSDQALIGVHYFRNKKIFKDAYDNMKAANDRAPNNEFYLSLMYNAMIKQGKRIISIPLEDNERFHPTGEPADYFKYINSTFPFIISHLPNIYTDECGTSITITRSEEISSGICVMLSGENKGDIFRVKEPFTSNEEMLIIQSDIVDFPEKANIKDMTRGWFVGNFDPAFIKTDRFEVGVLTHKQGERWDFHVHDLIDEYNYLVSGTMKINGVLIKAGDKFILKKGCPSCPEFLSDCVVVCVKNKSIPTDKRLI